MEILGDSCQVAKVNVSSDKIIRNHQLAHPPINGKLARATMMEFSDRNMEDFATGAGERGVSGVYPPRSLLKFATKT